MFADDTVSFLSYSKFQLFIKEANSRLSAYEECHKANKLSLHKKSISRVLDDIRMNLDAGCFAAPVLLANSAAFNPVDNGILIDKLENWIGLIWITSAWFKS